MILGVVNRMMSWDYKNFRIINTSQNTEKSPGNLRRFVLTQSPVKKKSANGSMENSQKSVIIIITLLSSCLHWKTTC